MRISKFYSLLSRSVESAEQWQDVLAGLCAVSGAKKAIIALRDNKTAELVIPDRVGREFFSPMLFGFSEAEVESYLTRYSVFDPWTAIERRRRPIVPYALSDYLPDAKLRASTFWEWLEGQGISDTCVAELERGRQGWVALNLYFDSSAPGASLRVAAVMRKAAPAISRSWKIFQQIQKYRDGAAISPRFMAAFAQPAMFFDQAFEIVAINEDGAARFAAFVGDGARPCAGAMPAALRGAVEAILSGRDGKTSSSDPTGERLVVRPVHRAEDVVGRQIHLRLATLETGKIDPASGQTPLWENAALTAREREAVKAASQGVSMSAYAKTAEISVNTAKAYLRDARRKLGGVSTKEIYARSVRP